MPGSIPESATADALAAVPPAPVLATRRAWALLARRKPLGAMSAVVIVALAAVALLAPLLAPYPPDETHPNWRLFPPNEYFLLGTDELGRDVLSRIIFGSRIVYGTRVSLVVGFASVIIGTMVGTVLGLLSGYCEGQLDYVIQRAVDTTMAIPGIVLALAVMSVLGQSLTNIIIVIALVIAPGASRVVRGAVLAVKQSTFIDAAQALGAAPARIVARHVLPNVFAPILVIATVWLGNAIVIEAALSFLGLGTPPPTPTWGAMLSGEGRRNLETAPYLAIFPGLAISIVVLAFNMLGDALRDLLDPRLRSR
jgi:ABC-type dipeptide/oligopeptide/nickel transport system permease subunit